jgi:hypothetical protein
MGCHLDGLYAAARYELSHYGCSFYGRWRPVSQKGGYVTLPPSILLIHTIKPLIELFDLLSAELMPGVTIRLIQDESILERIRQNGVLTDEDTNQVITNAWEAEMIGADTVLVTCSPISPCVDAVRLQIVIPVFKIDEALIAKAVKIASRIGVVAPNVTSLLPTRQMLLSQADGKPLEIEMRLSNRLCWCC